MSVEHTHTLTLTPTQIHISFSHIHTPAHTQTHSHTHSYNTHLFLTHAQTHFLTDMHARALTHHEGWKWEQTGDKATNRRHKKKVQRKAGDSGPRTRSGHRIFQGDSGGGTGDGEEGIGVLRRSSSRRRRGHVTVLVTALTVALPDISIRGGD